MPKLSERDRLAELVARQKRLDDDIITARHALRERYARIIPELAVEKLTEREFRDLVDQAIGIGGAAALAALKACPPAR